MPDKGGKFLYLFNQLSIRTVTEMLHHQQRAPLERFQSKMWSKNIVGNYSRGYRNNHRHNKPPFPDIFSVFLQKSPVQSELNKTAEGSGI